MDITLDPVPYYIYPSLVLLLVLNLLNLKPVSYGIPYHKERLRKIKNFNSFKTELSNYLIDNITYLYVCTYGCLCAFIF